MNSNFKFIKNEFRQDNSKIIGINNLFLKRNKISDALWEKV